MGLFTRETSEERARREEMAHAERMKCIELGRTLPDVEVARAKALQIQAKMDAVRSNVNVIFGAVGPAGIIGITTGASAVILHEAAPTIHLPLLAVIWPCAALVCLGMITAAWARSRGLGNAVQLLRELQARIRPAITETQLASEKTDGILDPTELTPEDLERLSRAIQQ